MKCMHYLMSLSAFVFLGSCGDRQTRDRESAVLTPVEQAFVDASKLSGVPARLLMATVYVESGLRAEQSSAVYLIGDQLGPKIPTKGESAVGFSFSELGIGPEASLTEQIAAYAVLLKSKVGNVGWKSSSVTSEEKMRWIWALARAHRGSDAQQNLLSVFSKELIGVLNRGFSVQDGQGVIARLEKEATPLREEDLPENYRQDLQLDMYRSDIRSAYLFSLARSNPAEGVNNPLTIEVVHCPFSLSTCIELQNSQSTDTVPMGAHYIIPSSDQEVPGILQFAHHDEIVSLMTMEGLAERVNNRIVVMLAGLSGRYKEGRRAYADPLWVTDFQLRNLGVAINEICVSLSRSHGVNQDECRSVNGVKGVSFRVQKNERFHWADIADFDETIFGPYIVSSDHIAANTSLTLSPEGQQQSGTPFRLIAGFQVGARRIELERLVRCSSSDQRVVWEPVDQRQVRQISNHAFENVWYDSGPNGTGEQFFRVKAAGEGGRFMGWSTKRVQFRTFEKDSVPEAPSKYCLRNGS